MAPAPQTVRCPRCGGFLTAYPWPAPPTQWVACPHCRTPVPVVLPRERPPLFSWEVYPGLYPPLPPLRSTRWRTRGLATAVLLASVIVAAGLGGMLVYEGWAAMAPRSFAVGGTVYESPTGGPGVEPAAGATVTLVDDAGATYSVVTGSTGSFSFEGIRPGGVELNVTLAGYSTVLVQTFVSAVYVAGGSPGGLAIVLDPGPASNETVVDLTPFPSLESFVATIWSGAALLGLAAIVAGVAAVVTWRADRPAPGVAGGAAMIAAPLALEILSVGVVEPLVVDVSLALAALGAVVLVVRGLELVQSSAPADLD